MVFLLILLLQGESSEQNPIPLRHEKMLTDLPESKAGDSMIIIHQLQPTKSISTTKGREAEGQQHRLILLDGNKESLLIQNYIACKQKQRHRISILQKQTVINLHTKISKT